MTNSKHLLKPKQNVPDFFSFQNGWFWCPKNYDVFNQKWQSLLKPTFFTSSYYRMATPTLFLPQNGCLYGGQPLLFYGGNGEGDKTHNN